MRSSSSRTAPAADGLFSAHHAAAAAICAWASSVISIRSGVFTRSGGAALGELPKRRLAPVGLGDCLKERALLLSGDLESLVILSRDNGDDRRFGQRLAFQGDLAFNDPSRCDFDDRILHLRGPAPGVALHRRLQDATAVGLSESVPIRFRAGGPRHVQPPSRPAGFFVTVRPRRVHATLLLEDSVGRPVGDRRTGRPTCLPARFRRGFIVHLVALTRPRRTPPSSNSRQPSAPARSGAGRRTALDRSTTTGLSSRRSPTASSCWPGSTRSGGGKGARGASIASTVTGPRTSAS